MTGCIRPLASHLPTGPNVMVTVSNVKMLWQTFFGKSGRLTKIAKYYAVFRYDSEGGQPALSWAGCLWSRAEPVSPQEGHPGSPRREIRTITLEQGQNAGMFIRRAIAERFRFTLLGSNAFSAPIRPRCPSPASRRVGCAGQRSVTPPKPSSRGGDDFPEQVLHGRRLVRKIGGGATQREDRPRPARRAILTASGERNEAGLFSSKHSSARFSVLSAE